MSAVKVLEVLFLLLLANGAPILAARLLPGWLNRPLDGGRRAWDGRPLLGPSKTWRGLLAALVLTPLAAGLLGYAWIAGLIAGAAAMAGDCLSSFLKRRLGLAPSDMALALDQIPEAALPALALMPWLELTPFEAAGGAFLFIALEVPISLLLYRLGLRNRPY